MGPWHGIWYRNLYVISSYRLYDWGMICEFGLYMSCWAKFRVRNSVGTYSTTSDSSGLGPTSNRWSWWLLVGMGLKVCWRWHLFSRVLNWTECGVSLHDVFCVFFKDGLLISNMFLIDHGGIIVDESIRFNKNRQGSMLPEASQRWMAILSTGPWRRLGQGTIGTIGTMAGVEASIDGEET